MNMVNVAISADSLCRQLQQLEHLKPERGKAIQCGCSISNGFFHSQCITFTVNWTVWLYPIVNSARASAHKNLLFFIRIRIVAGLSRQWSHEGWMGSQ
jgi:hypothetical protein